MTGKECQGDSKASMILDSSCSDKDVLNLKCGEYNSSRHTKECNNGILLYALHLRFLCPLPRKSSRAVHKCKSAELRNIAEIEDERRFYLYEDMRVVFPQRHSDADEGKVCGSFWVVVKAFTIEFIFFLFYLMYYIMAFSCLTLQLHVQYHFPSNPKYFDVSS